MNEIAYNDIYGRQFKSLRVSLTQACDFACLYCVPEGLKFKKLKDELKHDEFKRAILLLHDLIGIEKIRITGGEPLIYNNFTKFIECLGDIDIGEKSITSNGSRMERYSDLLWRNGFTRINFSLDSLDNNKFKKITRGGELSATLAGIEKTREIGFKLKMNLVAMRSINHDEIVSVLDFCLERGIELRYIELMKMGHVNSFFESEFIPQREILELISAKYNFQKAQAKVDSTSLRYEIPGVGFFGIIANESSPFCSGCNRLRLTSNGRLYGCISAINSYDIKEALTLSDEQAKKQVRTLLCSAMNDKQIKGFIGAPTYMKHLGG